MEVSTANFLDSKCYIHDFFFKLILTDLSMFRFEDMMDETTIKIRNNLLEFTTDFCKIDGHEYKPKNVFVLSGENVISSLVLKLQKEELDEETIVQKCQRQLLWITAPEAMIRIRHTILWEKKPNKVKRLEKQYYDLPLHNGLLKLLAFFNSKNWRENNDPSEMRCESSLAIVFTYDHEVDFLNNQSTNFAVEWFRNFESERQLNKSVHQFFDSDFNQLLLICNSEDDFRDICLAGSIRKMCKKYAETSLQHKNVCIICLLDRQKNESMNKINFLSDWKLVMLDKLCEPITPLPDMICLTLEDVLESRRPLTETFRNHIFWAFTTIQYIGIGHASERMMRIASQLEKADYCLSIIEELVFVYINKSSETQFDNWQKTVALNEGGLVKASCFMNAIEQYMLEKIKNPLCKIIFKLEETNALDCVFLKDDCREKRILLWSKFIMKEKYIDIADMKDPCGPKCYLCSSRRMALKFPFSYIIVNKIEKLKEEFLKTLQNLRIAKAFTEGDELETSVLIKFVKHYNNYVEEHLIDYINEDYPDKFIEYQYDFYFMMSSQEIEVLNEEEKVQIMKRVQSLFDTGEYFHDFALQVTNLHVLHWVYSSVFDSFIKIMSVVKKNTDTSVVSFLSEMTVNPVSLDKEEEEGIKKERHMLVDRLSKIFLPTTNLMIKFSSVQKWQYLVSSVLPFLAEISFDSPSMHVLRFCNDVAQALHSLDQNAAVTVLSTFGDSLRHHKSLGRSEMFQFVMKQINILREESNVHIENIQRFLCQYLNRSVDIYEEENAALKSFLMAIPQKQMLDRNLQLFGPILDIVLDIENDKTDLMDVITMNLKDLHDNWYLYYINHCICECPDSNIPFRLVTTLQSIYQKRITLDRIESTEESSDEICELAIKANGVLRISKGCSLILVASVAYLKAFIHEFVNLLVNNKINAATLPIITKRINALMETSADTSVVEDLRAHCLFVYFLKCLTSVKEGFELKKTLLDLEKWLPVLQNVNKNDEFMTRSVTYDPLFMYRTIEDKCFENALLSMEKPDEKELGEIIDHALTDNRTMFSFVGLIASTFFLKSQQK